MLLLRPSRKPQASSPQGEVLQIYVATFPRSKNDGDDDDDSNNMAPNIIQARIVNIAPNNRTSKFARLRLQNRIVSALLAVDYLISALDVNFIPPSELQKYLLHLFNQLVMINHRAFPTHAPAISSEDAIFALRIRGLRERLQKEHKMMLMRACKAGRLSRTRMAELDSGMGAPGSELYMQFARARGRMLRRAERMRSWLSQFLEVLATTWFLRLLTVDWVMGLM